MFSPSYATVCEGISRLSVWVNQRSGAREAVRTAFPPDCHCSGGRRENHRSGPFASNEAVAREDMRHHRFAAIQFLQGILSIRSIPESDASAGTVWLDPFNVVQHVHV